VAKPCEIINRYDNPRIDKICELNNVLVSAAYMFQSMPGVADGSEDEVEDESEDEVVKVRVSFFPLCAYLHTTGIGFG
jgi:hypothetical protein